MTDEYTITTEEVDRIERGRGSRPWGLHQSTQQEASAFDGVMTRVDSVFVEWGAQEPIDWLQTQFSADTRTLDRNDRTIAELATDVADIVEDDQRLEEYVVWDGIEPEVTYAELDESRSRVSIEWAVRGEDDD